jgi:hypothetical protein
MNYLIGIIGIIKEISKAGNLLVEFESGEIYYYPADQIEAHLVEENLSEKVYIPKGEQVAPFYARPSQEEIEKHLKAKPKFPKVWAWDDDVSQAFETYLIAVLDECYAWDKRNYKYMVVSKEGINGFENKSTFDIEFLLNIQATDPRLNDIIAVVEKYGKDFVIKTVEKL